MNRICDFTQVVRRNVCRHADSNARRSVHEQVWKRRGKHQRFVTLLVVCLAHIDGFLFQVFEHHGAELAHLGFRITHRSRAVPIDGTKVSLANRKRITQRKILRHANQGIVDSGIAMRMVFAHHLSHDICRLYSHMIRRKPELVHAEKDAPVNGL